MKLISCTQNGQILYCPRHDRVFLEFGNILLRFNYEALETFTEYVNSIDSDHFIVKNNQSFNRKEILLDIGYNKAYFGVTQSEFLELKELLTLEAYCPEKKLSKIKIDKIHLN